jgi:hypothetical protein
MLLATKVKVGSIYHERFKQALKRKKGGKYIEKFIIGGVSVTFPETI